MSKRPKRHRFSKGDCVQLVAQPEIIGHVWLSAAGVVTVRRIDGEPVYARHDELRHVNTGVYYLEDFVPREQPTSIIHMIGRGAE